MGLSEEQIQRYSRHILLPGVGGIGQERLLASSVLIAFSAEEKSAALVALVYLAAGGVGRVGWCPLDGADGLKEESPLSSFLGACVGDGVRSLNPDCTLVSRYLDEEEVFDALVWLGDEASADFEKFEPSGRFTIQGVSAGEAGEILEGTAALGRPGAASRERGARTVATQGALGAWLAVRVLRRLVDEEDTVGSTAQARFDLSRGFMETSARIS